MKIEINDFWNGIEETYGCDIDKNHIVVAKHNIFHHSLTWFDAKTTTISQAIEFTDSKNIINAFDQIDLMILVKHESTMGWSCLQYAIGFYEKSYKRISQFRFCFETKEYKMLPIEGELLAFAFVDDLPLMRIFNEDEEM